MKISRREFLKYSGVGAGGVLFLNTLNLSCASGRTARVSPLQKRIGEKTTICPYDASGCGFLVAAEDGKVINIEGDPDHPINRGSACSKGASLRQLGADTPRRLSIVH